MKLDVLWLGRDASRIAEEVVQHLSGIVGVRVCADAPDAYDVRVADRRAGADTLYLKGPEVEQGYRAEEQSDEGPAI